jgi:hypothetical protein
MESLRGKTLRWTFNDGPVSGMLFEHTLNDDGTIVWRALDGPWKGHSDHLSTHRAFAFASGNNNWHSQTGTFEVVR